MANSLIEVHLGLQRSADHLENSVEKGWMRVGIGICINKNNQCIVTF
jgi:hypothetical protein